MKPGVDAVGDSDVNQTIFAAEWHSWLRPLLGERKQARANSSTQYEGQDLFTHLAFS
jgi:hypothetical protein